MKLVHAPHEYSLLDEDTRLFLAGSIDMGKAVDWQSEVAKKLDGIDNLIVLNPRRPDWDSSWKQTPDFKPFREQVTWEQRAISVSDIIIFNFAAGSQAPITLLELGIVLGGIHDNVLVCCPPEYHRHGNVVITCNMYGVEVYSDIDTVIELAKKIITERAASKK